MGVGFMPQRFGSGVCVFRFRIEDADCWVQVSGFRFSGSVFWLPWFRISGFGFIDSDFRLRISGASFRVSGPVVQRVCQSQLAPVQADNKARSPVESPPNPPIAYEVSWCRANMAPKTFNAKLWPWLEQFL